MKIGIIGAMSVEVEGLVSELADARIETVSGITLYSGTLCGKDVVIAMCGIGKVFAALCAQTMIVKYGVTHIINTGVGGSLSPELACLDVALASGLVQHDMDTSPLGDPKGLISGINIVTLPVSQTLLSVAQRCADILGINARAGIIASGDQFIDSAEKKREIADSFNAVCCEMEGAAIAQACYVGGVECLVIRSISDGAQGDAQLEYPKFVKVAADRSARLVTLMLAQL